MKPGQPGPSGETPIWEEPVRGFYTDPGQFVTLSGLDLLRNVLEGGLGPPIRYLFGLAPTSVEPGAVTFTMPVTDWLLFPQGVVSGATPTGGSPGNWGDAETIGQRDVPGSHHGADPDDHARAPALGGEQRGIAVGEAKRYVAELGHCLLHVEVGETGTDHVMHLRPGSGTGGAPMVSLAGGPQLGRLA